MTKHIDWHIGRIVSKIEFDEYPESDEEIWVETKSGHVYLAKYRKWDWSDSSCQYEFSFPEGNHEDVIAWKGKSK